MAEQQTQGVIQIDLNKLREKKLFVATPMYGGQCAGMYTKSMCDLTGICARHGIELRSYFLFNESLITRARNYCVDEFLRSGFTHFLFIDSDIGFDPNDIIYMLHLMDDDSPYDVMTGPYPKKCISWEKIKQAVDSGIAEENPNILENFVGDFVFNPVVTGENQVVEIPLDRPAEVSEAGTGFMMIKKDVFADYDKAYPHLMYRPDHVRTEHFDGTREIMAYFDCIIDPQSKRYLSEDYMFCYNVRRMGRKVFMCPWMKLYHVGTYIFGGNLAAMASVGASPTADVSKLGKGRSMDVTKAAQLIQERKSKAGELAKKSKAKVRI